MTWLDLSAAEWSALRLSVLVASGAVLLSAVPGILCGWMLARTSFRGKSIVDAVIHLPLVLPPVVIGYLLLLGLGSIAFTRAAAVVAGAVMGFPLLVRAVRLGVELVDRRLEEAARTLGAGPGRVFATVTLPLALPGIVTGLVLAFARSLGEFGATITFAGSMEGETRTLPLAIFNYVQRADGEGPAMRLVVISVALSLVALLISEILARRVSARLGHR